MKEIITVDGKQFKLMTDHPLTAQEKVQTIAEIRKQTGCSTCGSTMANLGRIQTLQGSECVTVNMLAPADITVQDITINGGDCTTGCDITCLNLGCTEETQTVTVTFANSGDVNGNITPELTVDEDVPIDADEGAITVAAGGTETATFYDVALSRGLNAVCVDWTVNY